MIRVGMVGSGNIASVHAQTIMDHPDLELAAVYSRNSERCFDFCSRYGAKPVASLQQLLSMHSLDAIVIASPTNTHSSVLYQASKMGKPIYCEKPIDLSYARCCQIASILATRRTRVMMGFNRRFDAEYAELAQTVSSRKLGALKTIQMISRGPSKLASIDYLRNSGGFFRDKGIHFFDLARFVTKAEPVSVYAAGRAFEPSVRILGDVDTAIMTLEMDSGALCVIENARLADHGYDEVVEIFGQHGIASTARFREPLSQQFPQSNFEKLENSFAASMDVFAKWIADEDVDAPTLADGLAAQTIAEAASISLIEKRVVFMEEMSRRYVVHPTPVLAPTRGRGN